MSAAVCETTNVIREMVNQCYKKPGCQLNETAWLKITAAIDVIEDCEWAVDYYCKTPPPDIQGAYLFVYGLLQVLYVQQDAVDTFCTTIGYTGNKCADIKELGDIRKIRNDVAGHPTHRNHGKEFVRLYRSELKKGSFTYVKISDTPSKSKQVDVKKIIADQSDYIYYVLLQAKSYLANLLSSTN